MRAERSGPDQGVAKDHHIQYYALRAKDAGLLISEGIPIDKVSGHMGCLMMDNEKQRDGLKRVVEAVHKNNGVIFA